MKLLEKLTYQNFSDEDLEIGEILTLTKSIFNDEEIREIIQIKKGYGHKSWKIDTENKSYLLKINVRHPCLKELENEVFAQNLARQVGVNTANVIAKGTLNNVKKHNFYIQEWITGEDAIEAVPNMSTIEYKKFFHETGYNLAVLHNKYGDYFGEDIIGFKKAPTWKVQCEKRLNDTLVSLKNSTLIDVKLLVNLEEKIKRRVDNLSDKISPSFVHGDLHLGNIVVDNGKFKALLDFESSRFADKAHDFVKLDNWVFSKYKDSYENFILGYRSISQFENDFDERLLLYKSIEILYSINYFGVLYPNKEMLKSFIELLYKVRCKI